MEVFSYRAVFFMNNLGLKKPLLYLHNEAVDCFRSGMEPSLLAVSPLMSDRMQYRGFAVRKLLDRQDLRVRSERSTSIKE